MNSRSQFSEIDVVVKLFAGRPGAEIGALAAHLRRLACDVEKPRKTARRIRLSQMHRAQFSGVGTGVGRGENHA